MMEASPRKSTHLSNRLFDENNDRGHLRRLRHKVKKYIGLGRRDMLRLVCKNLL